MTASEPPLREYLDMVRKLLGDHRAPAQTVESADVTAKSIAALRKAGVLDLARETASMTESLSWLAASVTEAATVAPSLGFALAAHYVVDRAAADVRTSAPPSAGTAGLVVAGPPSATGVGYATAVVPTVLDPDIVLLIDSDRIALVPAASIRAADQARGFSGLRGAVLREVRIRDDSSVAPDDSRAPAAGRDWAVLCSAVLVGISRAAARSAATYSAQRRQFGSALTSFAAVRAMLGNMQVAVEGVDALLERAVRPGATDAECWQVVAEAGRVAVDVALDAIQVHGGYGYVEEYPVAGLLRDALSVRARSGGRRAALSRLTDQTLGAPTWETA